MNMNAHTHSAKASPQAGSVANRRLAETVAVVLLFIGCLMAIPQPAKAQVQGDAYGIVALRDSWTIALRPGERLALGQMLNFLPLDPSTALIVATASANGGVLLDGTTSVARLKLATLLATGVTATADGTVTLIVDANVSIAGTVIVRRSVVTLKINSTTSNYRMTPTATPFRMAAGTTHRLRDIVNFEKRDPRALFSNFGFEVSGGVTCVSSDNTPIACRPVTSYYNAVYTQQLLDSRFAATASGRLTIALYLGGPFERFVVDIEATGPAPAPVATALIASTPGAAFVIVPFATLPSVTDTETVPLGKFVNVQPILLNAQITSITFQTSAGALLNGASSGAIAPSLGALLNASVTATSDGGISIFIQAVALQPGQVVPTPSTSVGAVSVKFVAPTGAEAATAPTTPTVAATASNATAATTIVATKSTTGVGRTTKKIQKKR